MTPPRPPRCSTLSSTVSIPSSARSVAKQKIDVSMLAGEPAAVDRQRHAVHVVRRPARRGRRRRRRCRRALPSGRPGCGRRSAPFAPGRRARCARSAPSSRSPGAIAFTLTPCGAHSFASAIVSCETPPLLAAYDGTPNPPWKLSTEAMFTILPLPCATMIRPASWQSSNVAVEVHLDHLVPVGELVVDRVGRRCRCRAS